mgnify:FL=1
MGLTFETVRPDALDARVAEAWRAVLADDARLAGPFFTPEYATAAGRWAPGAAVAVARRRGAVAALLPFQARGRRLFPLGAPLTDYHGLIAAPGESVSLGDVLRGMGAAEYRATAWAGDGAEMAAPVARRRMVADLSKGFEAWRAGRASVVKDKLRRGRALARDHGEPRFTLDDGDPAAFDWLLARKRAQYAESAQHDVFACGWTERLLRDLLARRGEPLAASIATLRIGARIVAAELSVSAGGVRHLWFPAYARAFSRYSPGTLLLIEQIRAAAERGEAAVDFGPDVEGYKSDFADPGAVVLEGDLRAAGPAPAPALSGTLRRLALKARRRHGVIRACEADRWRAAGAAFDSLAALARGRLDRAGASVGVGSVYAAEFSRPLLWAAPF